MANKKTSYYDRTKQNEVNKKAIIWVASIFAGIVVVLSLLLIFEI
ncbi:MAG TPA: hypothetical protein VF260_12615 [Bacilli bacterium]